VRIDDWKKRLDDLFQIKAADAQHGAEEKQKNRLGAGACQRKNAPEETAEQVRPVFAKYVSLR
jgi:hypothetical protein